MNNELEMVGLYFLMDTSKNLSLNSLNIIIKFFGTCKFLES